MTVTMFVWPAATKALNPKSRAGIGEAAAAAALADPEFCGQYGWLLTKQAKTLIKQAEKSNRALFNAAYATEQKGQPDWYDEPYCRSLARDLRRSLGFTVWGYDARVMGRERAEIREGAEGPVTAMSGHVVLDLNLRLGQRW
jgi:hypothetical protein